MKKMKQVHFEEFAARVIAEDKLKNACDVTMKKHVCEDSDDDTLVNDEDGTVVNISDENIPHVTTMNSWNVDEYGNRLCDC